MTSPTPPWSRTEERRASSAAFGRARSYAAFAATLGADDVVALEASTNTWALAELLGQLPPNRLRLVFRRPKSLAPPRSAGMSLDAFESLVRPRYVNIKIFADPNLHYAVVASLVGMVTDGADMDEVQIVSTSTGRHGGALVGTESRYWAPHAASKPDSLRMMVAPLEAFTRAARGEDGLPQLDADLVLSVVDAAGRPFLEDAEFLYPARRTLPFPDRENIVRVAGDVGLAGFLLGGATWFHRLRLLTRRYLGRDVTELSAVLDWGVGCARIARHFLEAGATNIHGADIDALNVDWCREVLGWDGAIRIGFDPPMPWPDESFDVVYGHSVFTHLALADQQKWIAELRRVTRVGGFAFVTICSEGGVYLTRWRHVKADPTWLDAFYETGFYDFHAQDVGVDAGRPGYYRLVANSRGSIMRDWSNYFRIRRILPCFFDHQDLVILERTA